MEFTAKPKSLTLDMVSEQVFDSDVGENGGFSGNIKATFQEETISTRRLVAKIDWHILPTITLIYVMAFLDRINFGNALIFGLRNDLQLRGQQANICISAFFVAYVVFEIPATMLMKYFKPHIFLSVSMFAFGILTLVQGFVHNLGGLIAARFLMGVAEAGVYPGCFYLMSMWYRRCESQRRFSFFVCGASFAGAFGGLLATGIGNMDGVRGYAAWRWIFILEGLLTCVLSVGFFFTIADFPEDVKWLTEKERSIVTSRLATEQGPSGIKNKLGWRSIVRVLKDANVLMGAPLYFCVSFSGYGLAFFIPSIVVDFGYSPLRAQLLSVAPWSCALVSSLLIAYFSDRFQRRFPFIVGSLLVALAGNLMLFRIRDNVEASYSGIFLYLSGVMTAVPLIACWYAMNLEGHEQRSIGIPWQIGIGNVSGIASTFAFPPHDAPRYVLAYSLGIGFLCLAIVISTSYFIGYKTGNKKLGENRYLL